MSNKITIQTNKKIEQTCPVCKNVKLLTLHHILPRYIFRQITSNEREYFLNGNNSYWMCSKCHGKYEKFYAEKLKASLLEKFNCPEESKSTIIRIADLSKIKNLCRYLTGKYKRNNYNYSIYQAYDYVIKFFSIKYMAYDEIEKLSIINENIRNPKYINCGKFLLENMSVEELDNLYRENLLKYLQTRGVKKGNLIPKINKHYEI